ncbi:uncharacterized protein PV09_03485 [Verruconis gallopava]|uniref:Uncharacterized protein n=1 Tax=Verruconis gallopava TaxID=253628 RepID=A0A0D2B2U4_9PEZI|nr:uncharacterized protein PV09_03485 [Verruconis gallopava]KIW05614.1 hypothetical protein PV09_03485 [Verruconis gallopava]
MAVLSKRYVCDVNGYCYYTSWDTWVRWVVLVVVIALFLLAFFLCSCSSARRRRRQGLRPYYGTGWSARPWYRQDPYYQNYPPAPPQYSANVPPGHQAYGGIYAPGNGGIELQQPPHSYAAGRSTDPDVYAPPEGPPPRKGLMK